MVDSNTLPATGEDSGGSVVPEAEDGDGVDEYTGERIEELQWDMMHASSVPSSLMMVE